MKWIVSQDKTSLLAPDSGITIAIHSFERTGSPSLHGTYYSIVALALGATDVSREIILGSYATKEEAIAELERLCKSEDQVFTMRASGTTTADRSSAVRGGVIRGTGVPSLGL